MARAVGVAIGALIALFAGIAANAADINVMDLPGAEISIVVFNGEIVEGDGQKFADVTKDMARATIILESPGGLVKEALQIGAEIRTRGLATSVLPDQGCFSACGLIWVSGERRYISPTSLIGFHAAYREENGEYRESGVANAEIGSYLTHLGLRIEAIRFFTTAGPDDFLLLTPERARALGIDVYEVEGSSVVSPYEKPRVDVYADRFVSYALLNSRCALFFHPDTVATNEALNRAFEAGNQLVPSEKWISLWTPMLDEAKSDLRTKGALSACLKTEAHLRNEGQPTGIVGPSFPCSAAKTATEKALCDEASLWAQDRAMNSIYIWVRGNIDKSARQNFLRLQRDWLGARNKCGSSVSCLTTIYEQRLSELKLFDFPS